MSSTSAQNLERLVEWNRQASVAIAGPRARTFGSVGIIGAGRMGAAIAAAHVRCRVPVVVHDIDAKALEAAMGYVVAEVRENDADLSAALGDLLRLTSDLAEVARCDLVIESIVETLSVKQQLYARLRPHLGEKAILVSNTSTIPIGRLSAGLGLSERFCGMHFCHPVNKRPLVEIVRGAETANETIAAAVGHVVGIGKIPIVVADGPGFVVNRLLFPYLGEALAMLGEGASIESIEQTAAEFGMAMGPLRLMDEIGLDTTLQAGWGLATAFPERIAASPILVSMVKAGRLGQKGGAGFFAYREPMSEEVAGPASDAIAPIIAPWLDSAPGRPRTVSSDRLILPMLLEATRILDEGNVRDARDIDLAVLFGLGFPVEKGGLLFWADTLGAERIVSRLQSLAALGQRFEPTPRLQSLAASGQRFYG